MSFPPVKKRAIEHPTTLADDNIELWTQIINYDILPIYYVSTLGRVFSQSRDRICSLELSNVGYLRVNVVKSLDPFKTKHLSVHRLVKEMFDPIPNMDKMVVNHINGNKLDNRLSNLEWTTYQGNTQHALRTKLTSNWRVGDECSWASIDSVKADEIGKMIALGYKNVDIHYITGAPKTVICNIKSGISWKDVYIKYKLWRIKPNVATYFDVETSNLINDYIDKNIQNHSISDLYRSLVMDICAEILHKPTDRKLYTEIVDLIYIYLDQRNMI